MQLYRYLPNSLQGRYDLITLGRKEHTWSLNLVIDIDISLILFYMEEMYFFVFEKITVRNSCIIQRLFENPYLPGLVLEGCDKFLIGLTLP